MSLPTSSSSRLVNKHDGHIEGYLNCIALRHGWTRTFSLSPAEVNSLDFSALERLLELSTLRLRTLTHLRVYVENPVDSGTFCKVRFWKDDGSLQSVLLKDFFESRMREGAILRFEIRDGRERVGVEFDEDLNGADSVENGTSVSGSPSKGKKRSISFDWFRRGTKEQQANGAAGDESSPKQQSRTRSIFDFFQIVTGRKQADTKEPQADNEDTNEVSHEDGEHIQLLPGKRKKSNLRARFAQTSSPFFGSVHRGSVVSITRERKSIASARAGSHISAGSIATSGATSGRTEDDSAVDTEAQTEDEGNKQNDDAILRPILNNALNRLRPFLAKSASPSPAPPPPPPKQVKKRGAKHGTKKSHSKDNQNHFQGADIVKRPLDAFPPRALPKDGKQNGSAAAADDSLEMEEDPFRG